MRGDCKLGAHNDAALVREKVDQAIGVLKEEGIDSWILLGRESDVLGDPSLPFIAGTSVTWESAFILTANGDRVAIVGTADVPNVEGTGAWTDVIGYVEGMSKPFLETIQRLDPRSIALNFSPGNYMADGLTYGMWLNVQGWLAGTPYLDRIVTGEDVVTRVRGRKSPEEIRRTRNAVNTTVEIWNALIAWLRPGLTEREIQAFMHAECERRGLGTSWDRRYCPTVTAGPESPVGHTLPGEFKTTPGELLRIDFGVNQEDYTSDMQRTFYFLREGETEAPADLREQFAHIDAAIQMAAAAIKPGVIGWEIDKIARDYFAENNLPTWNYGLGHQMGRACHDGGVLLGPRWERYGELPNQVVEENHVYVLETGFSIPNYGLAVIEDDFVVTANGIEWLAPPQRELILIGAH